MVLRPQASFGPATAQQSKAYDYASWSFSLLSAKQDEKGKESSSSDAERSSNSDREGGSLGAGSTPLAVSPVATASAPCVGAVVRACPPSAPHPAHRLFVGGC